jgi:hypothetical protein
MKPMALDLCCGKGGWTNGLLAAGWDVIGVDIEKWDGYQGHFLKADVRELKVKKFLDYHDIEDAGGYGHKSRISLVVASPPCQEFSYSSFPFKKAREKFTKEHPPDRSIWDACVRIAKELNAPLILENVRGAQKWMGKAAWHYGSFCFWGEMPALIPVGKPRKGFQQRPGYIEKPSYSGMGRKTEWRGNVQGKGRFGWNSAEVQDQRMNAFPGENERPVATYKNHRGPEMSATRDKAVRLANGTRMSGRGAAQHGHHKSNARKEWSAKAAMIPLELSTWIGQIYYPKEAVVTDISR